MQRMFSVAIYMPCVSKSCKHLGGCLVLSGGAVWSAAGVLQDLGGSSKYHNRCVSGLRVYL